MNKSFLAVALLILSGSVALAQTSTGTSASGQATSSTSASARGRTVNIASGTQIAAQLQHTLDARRARVGDEVVLKTTENIKQNGRTVVSKGARLIGHVTEVQQSARSNGESRIGLVFDRLERGNLEVPITATITSITQSRTRARSGSGDDDLLGSDTRSSSSGSASAGGSSGGGGLLGGVGNTVGNVVGSTTQAVGNTVGSTTGAVGSTVGGTTRGLNRTLGSIQITQAGSADAQGGSMLSLTGGNLRLESGTTFHLTLSQTSSVRNDEQQ